MSAIPGISNASIQQFAQQANSVGQALGSNAQTNVGSISSNDGTSKSSKGDFGTQLMDVMNQLNETQQNAAQKETDFMTGQHEVDYHDLMISMEKASISLQLATNVRNKLLDAYQTISSMQV